MRQFRLFIFMVLGERGHLVRMHFILGMRTSRPHVFILGTRTSRPHAGVQPAKRGGRTRLIESIGRRKRR